MTATTDPRSWSVDRLRAAHSAYVCRDRSDEAVLGNREYERRRSAARRAGVVWPPIPASPPALPPLGPRLPGEPRWPDAVLRAADRRRRWAGADDPLTVAQSRLYRRLMYRRRVAERRAQPPPGTYAPQRALLEDARELARQGETLEAATARLGRKSTLALERALCRRGPDGHEVIRQLKANASGEGHVRQGAIRRGAA